MISSTQNAPWEDMHDAKCALTPVCPPNVRLMPPQAGDALSLSLATCCRRRHWALSSDGQAIIMTMRCDQRVRGDQAQEPHTEIQASHPTEK